MNPKNDLVLRGPLVEFAKAFSGINVGVSGAGRVAEWATVDLQKFFDTSLREWFFTTIRPNVNSSSEYLFPPYIRVSDETSDKDQSNEIKDLQAEREHLKTTLILLHRQVLELQTRLDNNESHIARLERQNDGQLACISQLAGANAALQGVLIARENGKLTMHETSTGVVSRRLDDGVVIEFETSEGPLEQFYETDQFVPSRIPEDGERIEVHVFAWEI